MSDGDPSQDGWSPASATLVELLPRIARGPRRGGVFAIWLTVRVAQDLLLDSPPAERAHRRRLQALEQRISSLTMPATLRRALASALNQLREGTPQAAAQVLSQLAAPAAEAGGAEAGEAVGSAARAAKAALRER